MKLGRRANIALLISHPTIALVVGVVIGMFARSSSTPCATPTSSTNAGHDSVYEQYRFAAVTTDTNICSRIGRFEDITCYDRLPRFSEKEDHDYVLWMFLPFFLDVAFLGLFKRRSWNSSTRCPSAANGTSDLSSPKINEGKNSFATNVQILNLTSVRHLEFYEKNELFFQSFVFEVLSIHSKIRFLN